MNTFETVTYSLDSRADIDAPTLFQSLKEAHQQGDTTAAAHMFDRWDVPPTVANKLLSGDIPHRIEGRSVVFELPCGDVLPFFPVSAQTDAKH